MHELDNITCHSCTSFKCKEIRAKQGLGELTLDEYGFYCSERHLKSGEIYADVDPSLTGTEKDIEESKIELKNYILQRAFLLEEFKNVTTKPNHYFVSLEITKIMINFLCDSLEIRTGGDYSAFKID